MKLDKVLLVLGILLVAYAIFSSFYGARDVACLGRCKSSTILLLGNTLVVLSIALKNK